MAGVSQKIMNQEQQELINLIEHSEVVDFAPFGDGISESWINKKEEELGIKLPASYRWWCSNYGGGEVFHTEIFSIYEMENVVGGDIAYVANINKKNHNIDINEKLYILKTGHHQAYFDTTYMENNEYPVVEIFDGNKETHANFTQFLISLISSYE